MVLTAVLSLVYLYDWLLVLSPTMTYNTWLPVKTKSLLEQLYTADISFKITAE